MKSPKDTSGSGGRVPSNWYVLAGGQDAASGEILPSEDSARSPRHRAAAQAEERQGKGSRAGGAGAENRQGVRSWNASGRDNWRLLTGAPVACARASADVQMRPAENAEDVAKVLFKHRTAATWASANAPRVRAVRQFPNLVALRDYGGETTS